jgi:H2-forming N5,N10-methylenetetrahydromethanopterin dehydrogenase-like enzyme
VLRATDAGGFETFEGEVLACSPGSDFSFEMCSLKPGRNYNLTLSIKLSQLGVGVTDEDQEMQEEGKEEILITALRVGKLSKHIEPDPLSKVVSSIVCNTQGCAVSLTNILN